MDRALPHGSQGLASLTRTLALTLAPDPNPTPTPNPNPNQNRLLAKSLAEALTGSSDGVTQEDPADPLSDDEANSDSDSEGARRAGDDDEALIAANEVSNKEFPLAHRLLNARGFRDNALLESVLTHPHEVPAEPETLTLTLPLTLTPALTPTLTLTPTPTLTPTLNLTRSACCCRRTKASASA